MNKCRDIFPTKYFKESNYIIILQWTRLLLVENVLIALEETLDPKKFLRGKGNTHITIPYNLLYWHAPKNMLPYPTISKSFIPAPKMAEFQINAPECEVALGLTSSSAIPNTYITASSFTGLNIPTNVRLNNAQGTWMNAPRGPPFATKEYIQVSLNTMFLPPLLLFLLAYTYSYNHNRCNL